MLIDVGTPVDVLTITNSTFRNSRINFHGNDAMPDYFKTIINITSSVFNFCGDMNLVTNSVDNKEIILKTSSNVELCKNFRAEVVQGKGSITVQSDLTGLNKKK
jgi:hypothetical protein